ncbi:MAG: Crp/Fnr family transcriptional regulator [Betaproteobacteria bacterium]|nr:Crp/Fnr family transcriptional regulator [Betaproteobacteria bacterium]
MTASNLRRTLDRVNPLTHEALAAIEALVSRRLVNAGQHLLQAGEPAVNIFFVEQGLLREYYLDSAGRESTRRVCKEGEFSGSLADLLAGGAAVVSIEVLEAGEVLAIDWASVDALAEQHPSLMKFLRRSAEALYLRKTRREFEMLTLSAAQRYRKFAQEAPGVDARLPRHIVASYLGITPVHLSRICAAERSAKLPPGKERKT